MNEPTIDEMLNEIDFSFTEGDQTSARAAITLWIPAEYKSKYRMLQNRSNNRFGKVVREILKRAIENACLESKVG